MNPKTTLSLLLIIFLQIGCNDSSNLSYQIASKISIAQAFNVPNSMAIIKAGAAIPGDICTENIKQLNDPLRGITAYYAGLIGSGCHTESCMLTQAIGINQQGSETHKKLITTYLRNDSLANEIIAQDCYLPPNSSSYFSDFVLLQTQSPTPNS